MRTGDMRAPSEERRVLMSVSKPRLHLDCLLVNCQALDVVAGKKENI